MKLNPVAILIYVSTLSAALMSVADVLPQNWLPYILVVGKLADAMTPRAARRGPRTSPPQTGRRQDGRIRLSVLLALFTLCLSLPLVTGCPKVKPSQNSNGAQNSNAAQPLTDAEARRLRERAERASKAIESTASDIETVGDVARELRKGALISEEGARAIATGGLDANSVLLEGVDGALSYGSFDEFARVGFATHAGKLRTALSNLNEGGALHIKNPARRAAFSTLLIASGAVINRLQRDTDEPIPEGVSMPLDGAIRRRLERAKETLVRNDRKLRADLGEAPPPKPSAKRRPVARLRSRPVAA